MKRALLFIITILIFFTVTSGWSQDSSKLLEAYKRNFAIASLDVKIQILKDAAKSESKEMGPLYLQAIDFVLDNASLIASDTRFRQLSVIAATQIATIGYEKAKYSLWKLFQLDENTSVRIQTIRALSVVAKGDKEIIESINKWLDARNNSFKSGKIPDLQVVAEVVRSLGELGDPSSFPLLFSSMILGYSDNITTLAKEALFKIKGDLKEMLIGIIKNQPIGEKKAALEMALESEKLTDDEKGEIAQTALDIALDYSANNTLERQTSREIRFIAIRALSERKWSKATDLVIEHLNRTIEEYEKGITDKSRLLEAITCLGNMGTHKAALRLTQYLVLLNSYTEKGKGYDSQIILAVLSNLGKLGDKVAFDDLMYTQYLNYSNSIKKEAKKALEKIKW